MRVCRQIVAEITTGPFRIEEAGEHVLEEQSHRWHGTGYDDEVCFYKPGCVWGQQDASLPGRRTADLHLHYDRVRHPVPRLVTH